MGHNPKRGRTAAVSRGSVNVIVEPSDKGAAFIAAISKAKVSVHLTMYLLSAVGVIDALLERAKAGIDVKVILNEDFAPMTKASNEVVFQMLGAGGVKVAWAPKKFALTHAKYMVVDAKEAWITTMNATTTALKGNREFLVRTTVPQHVADAEMIFASDFAGTPLATYTGPLVVAPLNAKAKIYDLISKAKKTIDIENEELSDANLTVLLTEAVKRKVVVRIVSAQRELTVAGKRSFDSFKALSIPTVVVKKPYIHAKAIVVDGKIAYVGSENFTRASLTANRELGIILTTKAAVSTVAKTFAADFASGSSV